MCTQLNRETRIYFPSHLKTKQNKAKQHIWNNCFQDPGHQATKVSDPRETGYKWHDPSLLLQVTTLREFLCCHTEGTQRGLVDSLIWGDGAGIWEKPGRLLFGRQYQRGESCIDRTLFICSGCPLSLVYQLIHVRRLSKVRKGLELAMPRAHNRAS